MYWFTFNPLDDKRIQKLGLLHVGVDLDLYEDLDPLHTRTHVSCRACALKVVWYRSIRNVNFLFVSRYLL